jgi:predicted amidohydrolase YtcJ
MRKTAIIALVLVAILAAVWYFHRPLHASMVLLNGIVHTVDDSLTIAQAIAIENGVIVGVGSTEEMRSRFTADTVVDLKGRAIYPGFTDAHAHLEGLGIAMMTLDLAGLNSIAAVREKVARDAERTGGRSWVRGRGWDQNRWEVKKFPACEDLDGAYPDVAVFLIRIDGHAAWVNRRALAIAGVTASTPDPPGGRILRTPDGTPTGVLLDNAIDLVRRVLPAPTREERMHAVRLAVNECLRVGLTGVHDMGVDLELISIYQELIGRGEFPFRVYAAVDGPGPAMDSMLVRGPIIGKAEDHLTVRAVKLYADGALGSRGAAMIEPYQDDPGNRGITMQSSDAMRTLVGSAVRSGFQVCTHAIGDRANAMVLDAYESVLQTEGKGRDLRLRIEHAQVLVPSDIPRFARLGVIPSMQPTHCTSDMYWAVDRLGPVRAKTAYAWRSLIDAGSIIPEGSDFPVEYPSPLLGFASAVTRQDAQGSPEGGWYPDQRMTRAEALEGFTRWAAYAAFQEGCRGSIEPGRQADLTILDKDIMAIPTALLRGARVSMTVVGGVIAYTGPENPGR